MFYRNLVLPVLEGLGCETLMARNGQEAQQLLEHQRPDLILTDLEMPELDGFGLTEWVRQQPNLQQLPVVAFSSMEAEAYADRAALFQACVKKFDREVLVEQLTRLLGRKPDKRTARAGVVDAESVHPHLSEQGGEQ